MGIKMDNRRTAATTAAAMATAAVLSLAIAGVAVAGPGIGPGIGATEEVVDNPEDAREQHDDSEPEPAVARERPQAERPLTTLEPVEWGQARESDAEALELLGSTVPPASYQRLSWSATELFEGIPVDTPVLVMNGRYPGPVLCLTAAVHGDELNGIEIVRRVLHDLDPQKLSGAVIGVPIVNLQAFRRGSRYLPDRRDLNRYFPGNPAGSAASRIAHSFFNSIVRHCDALVDLHTGSFDRANLPQLRADLRDPGVVTLTQGFGATVIINSIPADGTLRQAATDAGIPTVTLEAGGPSRLETEEVSHGVKGIETLLNTLGMVRKVSLWGDPEPVYYRSTWVRANRGGILLSEVDLGRRVSAGDLLGTITDPITNARTNIYAPTDGRVIGMALNQVVMPGYAAFHIGLPRPEPKTAEAAPAEAGGSLGDEEDAEPAAEQPAEEASVAATESRDDVDAGEDSAGEADAPGTGAGDQ
ncbi:succinylglutamate desuccinylase/aspartoacylase family protein [Lentisalinibacter orientalis]|uniref:succinylglutamate desuccinylase/aspartoacylase family protein n=1 Tax=Lentisalinibacter orientalis TaxID=2992241 RepID=UPI00386C2077